MHRPSRQHAQAIPPRRHTPAERHDRFRSGLDAIALFIRRTVTTNGALHFEGHYVYLSRALIGEDVGFEQVDETHWEVHFGPVILGELNAETGKVLCYQTLRVRPNSGA